MLTEHPKFYISQAEKNRIFQLPDLELSVEDYSKELDPPNEKLQISIVIPSYGEFFNNNFWRFLRSYALQTASPEFSEVIWIINNLKVAARLAAGSTQLGYIKPTEVPKLVSARSESLVNYYNENQIHLRVIGIIKQAINLRRGGESLDSSYLWSVDELAYFEISLTPAELSILRLAIKKQLIIHGIDASSETMAFPIGSGEHNVNPSGIARSIGGYVAAERLSEVGRNTSGLIDFIDGDCFLPRKYIARMIDLMQSKPDIVLKSMTSVIVDVPESFYDGMTIEQQLAMLISYVRTNIYAFHTMYTFNPIYNAVLTKASLGGPQTAVSPKLYEAVGGYDISVRDPDFHFGTKITQSSHDISLLPQSHVWLADRSRAESEDGKYRGGHIVESGRKAIIARINWAQDLYRWKRYRSLTVHLNSTMESSFLRTEYLEARRHYFRMEKIKRKLTIDRITFFVKEFSRQGYDFTKFLSQLESDRDHELAQEHPEIFQIVQYIHELLDKRPEEIAEMPLEKDEDFIETLRGYKTTHDFGIIMQILERFFPVLFNVLEQEVPFGKYSPQYNQQLDYSHIYHAAILVLSTYYNELTPEEKVAVRQGGVFHDLVKNTVRPSL